MYFISAGNYSESIFMRLDNFYVVYMALNILSVANHEKTCPVVQKYLCLLLKLPVYGMLKVKSSKSD